MKGYFGFSIICATYIAMWAVVIIWPPKARQAPEAVSPRPKEPVVHHVCRCEKCQLWLQQGARNSARVEFEKLWEKAWGPMRFDPLPGVKSK